MAIINQMLFYCVVLLFFFSSEPQVALLTQCNSLCVDNVPFQGHLLIPDDKLRVSARFFLLKEDLVKLSRTLM